MRTHTHTHHRLTIHLDSPSTRVDRLSCAPTGHRIPPCQWVSVLNPIQDGQGCLLSALLHAPAIPISPRACMPTGSTAGCCQGGKIFLYPSKFYWLVSPDMRQINRKSHEILMACIHEADPGKLSHLPQWLKLCFIYHSQLKIKEKVEGSDLGLPREDNSPGDGRAHVW